MFLEHSKVPSIVVLEGLLLAPCLCPVFRGIITVRVASHTVLLANLCLLARVHLTCPFTCFVSLTERVSHFSTDPSLCRYFIRARHINCNDINLPVDIMVYMQCAMCLSCMANILAGKW